MRYALWEASAIFLIGIKRASVIYTDLCDGTIYTAAICFSRLDLAESALLRVYETL